MAHIDYLGFVVRHEAEAAERAVVGCVAKLRDGSTLVWKAYPLADENFIASLFVIAVLIKQKLARLAKVEDGIQGGETLLQKPNPEFDFILNYLFDVWTKRTSYKSLPPDLRQATRFFFQPYGQKATLRLKAPQEGLRPDQIFFWTVDDFKEQTKTEQIQNIPSLISVSDDPPQSNSNILLWIPILAEKVRLHLARPSPWQRLYKQALKLPEDLPNYQIPLYGSKIELTKEKNYPLLYKEQSFKFSEMVIRHRKLLLTSSSGAGKTTVQKMLVADLLSPHPPISDCLPIFVPLKYVGLHGKSVTDLIVDIVVKAILSSDSLKSSIQQEIDIRRAKYGDTRNHQSLFESEVKQFFTLNKQKSNNQIALFLDAYNEIPESEEHNTEKDIQQLSQRVNRIVVSTHSYSSGRLLPGFSRFELEELSDEQIIDYLNHHFDGKGQEFFDDKIAIQSGILSMVRIPFYLELIVKYHQQHLDRKLPTCRGQLLRFFIQNQYDNDSKQDIKALRFPDVSESRINFVLSKIAYKLIDNGKKEAQTVLSFPSDVLGILASTTDLETTAKAAKLFGFLDKSGQIPEDTGAVGTISFSHDNIRDYFAAQELNNEHMLDNNTSIETYLEYRKWDSVLLMLSGIIQSEQVFRKALLNIAKHDPLFASECLLASPLASTAHSDLLLKVIPSSVVHMFLTQKDISSNRLNSDRCLYYQLISPFIPAFSRILCQYGGEQLLNTYFHPATDSLTKGAIPHALVLAYGRDAMGYLEHIVNTEGIECHWEVFETLSTFRHPNAYDLLAKLCFESIDKGDEDPDSARNTMLRLALWSYCGSVSIENVTSWAEKCLKLTNSKPNYVALARVVLMPLARGLTGQSQDWVNLYHNHPNKDVRLATRCILQKNLHPVLRDEIVQKCKTEKFKRFSLEDEDDFEFLLGLNPSEGEKTLLCTLKLAAERQNDIANNSPLYWIPHILTKYRCHSVLKELVRFCLHKKCLFSLILLYEIATEVKNETFEIIQTMPSVDKTNPSLQKRAIIGKGLCGDKTVEKDLLTIFEQTNLAVINLNGSSNKKRKQLETTLDILRCALFRIDSKRANVTAKQIAGNSLIKCAQSDLRIYQQYQWDIRRKQTVDDIIHEIEHTSKDCSFENIQATHSRVQSIANVWSTEQLENLLQRLSIPMSNALTNSNTEEARFLFIEIQNLRKFLFYRRFLHVFSCWPPRPK